MSIAEIVIFSAMVDLANALLATAALVYAGIILVWCIRVIRKRFHHA